MTLSSRLLLVAAGLALLPFGPALAADYDPPISIDAPEEYVPVEVGSGWYLRGDVGYVASARNAGTFNYQTYNGVTDTYGQSTFATASRKHDFTFGGGVGYNFTDWLRADATIDGFRARFNGTTVSATPCTVILVGTSCRSDDSSSMSGITFMANGYVDLGTYAGFTPYGGAGVGYTYVNWTTLSNSEYCVGVTCTGGLVATTPHTGLKSWRFSYALMGGVAYDVSKNFKLDLGYRYSKIAGGPMFGFDAASATAGAGGVQGRDPGFSRHEIRVGVRYSLW